MSLRGHTKRILIALIVLPILAFIIIKLPPQYFFGLIILVNIIGTWEFLRIYRLSNFWIYIGVLFSILIFLLNCFYYTYALYYYALSFMAITLFRLFFKRQPQGALNDISPIIIALMYIPTLLSFQWFLRAEGWQWLIYLYAVVWTADSFAYYFGKGFGKKKLYPEISPKKTWAGAYGSIIGGLFSSSLLGYFLFNLHLFSFVLMGLFIGFASILGDLVESMFKRDGGVKDSGFLFSEHGGVLDKIDAILYAGVILYFGMKLM